MNAKPKVDEKNVLENLVHTMPAIVGLVELESDELKIIMGNSELARFCRVAASPIACKHLPAVLPEFLANQ